MLEALAEKPDVGKAMQSVQQGAATIVWAAVARDSKDKSGKYLEDCHVTKLCQSDVLRDQDPRYLPYACKPQNSALL